MQDRSKAGESCSPALLVCVMPALPGANHFRSFVTIQSMRIIGHGIDAVEVARIEDMLREHGERFIERCFGDDERAYAEAGRRLRAQRYAARFACKEAVMKALGTGWRDGISWRDIQVRREPSGRPRVHLSGRCAELAAELQIAVWHLSVTHTESLAIASVIATD